MALIDDSPEGWRLNRINAGPPFHVATVGPRQWPQVEDARGTCALSGPNGAVFCASIEQAQRLADQANAGALQQG